MTHTQYPPNIKDCKKWFYCSGISSIIDSNLCLFSNTHSSPLHPPKYYIVDFQNYIGFPKPIRLIPLSLSRHCSLSPHYLTLLSRLTNSLPTGVSVSLLPNPQAHERSLSPAFPEHLITSVFSHIPPVPCLLPRSAAHYESETLVCLPSSVHS